MQRPDGKTTAELIAEGKLPAHYAVAKADGDGPVQAWIGLLPGWQAERARRIDAVVTGALPDVRKAVKWHGAWYGVPGQGWFLALNGFKRHLKLTFFDGLKLTPPPPVAMKIAPIRALDLCEADRLDDAQLARWVAQARALPGYGKA